MTHRMPPLILVILNLTLPLLSQASQAQEISIPHFAKVKEGVYRGGRPEEPGMHELLALGVKTDLDLEDDEAAVISEKAVAGELAIQFVSVPMSGFWKPTGPSVDRALAVLADPANYPVYVHCLHGEDRTGLIVGLFRVEKEGVAPATAYQEMLDHGFHKLLFLLNHYYEERTHWED